jgi:hypothetical protein
VDYEGHLRAESIEPLREAISQGVTVIMVTGRVSFTCCISHECKDIRSCNVNGPDLRLGLVPTLSLTVLSLSLIGHRCSFLTA